MGFYKEEDEINLILFESRYSKILIKKVQANDLKLLAYPKKSVNSIVGMEEKEVKDLFCLIKLATEKANLNLKPKNITTFFIEGKLVDNKEIDQMHCHISINGSEEISKMNLSGIIPDSKIETIKNLF
ncbi:MAG: hypothetical protein WC280_02085 [Patescibacteria group bacterium]